MARAKPEPKGKNKMTLIESLAHNSDGTVVSYAWPGGYPVYYVTKDGAALCVECVNKNIREIVENTLEDGRTGWEVAAGDVNWEDAELYCDNCNKRIESAYAEDAETEAKKDADPL
jgi:hypothetical protein